MFRARVKVPLHEAQLPEFDVECWHIDRPMRRRSRWLGLVVLAVVALILWWRVQPRPEASSGDPSVPVVQARVEAAADPVRAASGDAARTSPPALAVGTATIEVLVTAGGAAVPEAQLTLSQQRATSSSWRPTWEAAQGQTTDARGSATFPASTGTWVLFVNKEGFATTVVDVAKPAGETVTVVRVSLERGHLLRGVAVDAKNAAVVPAIIRAVPLGDRSTRRRSSPVGEKEVAVDGLGAFQFSALAAGWWRLEGVAEGSGRAEPVLINVPTNDTVRLRFRRAGYLEGVVVQPDGGVAPGALVAITSAEGADSVEASATGAFSSERMPGAYRVSARFGELVGSADQVALVHSGGTTTTRVVLSGKGGMLSGTVKRDDDVPVGGAVVIASPHNDDGVCGQTTTNPDGTWAIRSLARGSYDLEAEAQGLTKNAETGFFVSDGASVEVDLVLGRLGKIKGTVETNTGGPLRVRLLLRSIRSAFPERQALSDGAGHFEFDDVPPGPAFIRVLRGEAEVTRATDVTVKAGATSEVKVVVAEPVTLEVHLDRSRCARPSAITLIAVDAQSHRVPRGVPSTAEHLTLQLSPGEWQLSGWSTDDEDCGSLRARTITLEAGQKPEPITLEFGPREGTFDVTILEADGQPAPFANVTAQNGDEVEGTVTNADGVAKLSFRSATSFTVTANKQGRSARREGVKQAMTLKLGAAARIQLRLEGASGLTRVTALFEGDAFADAVRITGAEGWIEEMPVGTVTLVASNADDTSAGRTRVQTRAGQTAAALLRLEPVAQLHGRVQLPAGVTSAFIVLKSPLGSDGARVEPSGAFLFEKVIPGEYVARVECKQCGAIAAKPVKLSPGANVELLFR